VKRPLTGELWRSKLTGVDVVVTRAADAGVGWAWLKIENWDAPRRARHITIDGLTRKYMQLTDAEGNSVVDEDSV
jgi:hypothetical protein